MFLLLSLQQILNSKYECSNIVNTGIRCGLCRHKEVILAFNSSSKCEWLKCKVSNYRQFSDFCISLLPIMLKSSWRFLSSDFKGQCSAIITKDYCLLIDFTTTFSVIISQKYILSEIIILKLLIAYGHFAVI